MRAAAAAAALCKSSRVAAALARSLAGWLAVPRVCYGTDLLNALRAA